MFSIISKKNWIFFSSISYISPKRNSHCECWSVTDRCYKDPQARTYVNLPRASSRCRYNCINRNGARGAQRLL